MEYTKELITAGMTTQYTGQEVRINSIQRMIIMKFDRLIDSIEFLPITNIYRCPEELTVPGLRHYMIFAFDYEPQRNPMEIVKVTEKWTTTSFKERISLN